MRFLPFQTINHGFFVSYRLTVFVLLLMLALPKNTLYAQGGGDKIYALKPESEGAAFGTCVGTDGNRVIVGAPFENNDQGAAYIFYFNGTEWMQEEKLTVSDVAGKNWFGLSVSIDGSRAIIGAPYTTPFHGPRAYIFHLDGAEWKQEANISPGDNMTAWHSKFGSSVSIDGGRAIIGAPTDRRPGSNHDDGSASIYCLKGTDWEHEATLRSRSPIEERQDEKYFGSSVFLDGNRAMIGYRFVDDNWSRLFRYDANGWSAEGNLPGGGTPSNGNFTRFAAMNGNTFVVGGGGGSDNGSGQAVLYETIARPYAVSATNGKYADRVNLQWSDRSKSEESFYIYRDGEYIDYTPANVTQWNDHNAIPGRIHFYAVCAKNDERGESNRTAAGGWRWADGKIEGYVWTTNTEGVPDALVSVSPSAPGYANVLDFNGAGDFVYIPHDDDFNLDRWTIEAWVYPRGDGWILSRGTTFSLTFAMFYRADLQSAFITFTNEEQTGFMTRLTELSVPLNQWTHIAGTYDGSQLDIFINGFLLDTISASGLPIRCEEPVRIGRHEQVYFDGKIDDVRLWNVARDSSDIRADMHQTLKGDESGLTAYWAFDDSSQALPDIAVDFANNGGHHGVICGARWQSETSNVAYGDLTDISGKYSIGNIFYDMEREFTITPSKGNHGFRPQFLTGTLDLTDPRLAGINFVDTTAITVAGTIRYAGTTCGVEGVKILLDDDSTGVRTLANGRFSIQVDNPGTHTIRPYFGNSKSSHTFNPPQITRNIQDNVSDLEFWDTQEYNLTVIAGGPCGSSFGDATLSVQTIGPNPGCFDTTFTTNGSNPVDIVLPAQKYLMDVVALNPPNSDILAYFQPDTVDLMWQDTTQMFIYRTKPVIHVSGLLDFGHGDYEGSAIVDQYFPYDLLIEVFDKYGADSCHVQEGSVTVFDDVSRFSPVQVTLPLENGVARYRLMPGEPNIIGTGPHKYQKLFEVAAHVGQETQQQQIWMLIKGAKTRGETYASVSPELPIAILRDPPGDGSYAYLEKDSTISCSVSNSYREWDESGEWGDHKIGAVMEVGVTFWAVSIASEVGGYVMTMDNVVEGTENLANNELVTTLKMTERFQTSDDVKVIGPKGDIYVGASFNMLYGITDVVDYNPLTYQVELDTSLSWRPDGIETTYIYTEHHIRNYEIPKLINARNLTDDPAQRAKCEASIFTWNCLLAVNERLKEEAVYKENITFSADQSASYESSVTVDTSFSIEYEQYFDESAATGLGYVFASVPAEWGTKTRMGWCRGTVKGTNVTNTTTVGYVFNDDDTGDDFTVDIKEDKAFGTPVFDLVAGQSSCPWEPGTLARDGVDISINTFLIEDVPPGEPAVFELYCGNISQTNETRRYEVRLIAGSNPEGAAVTIGGNPTTDPIELDEIGPNSSLKQTLRVRREPPAFNFDNLQVMMYPACQYELYTQNMPIGIADTVTFSVHFANTGSPVTLSVPKEDWVIDQNDTKLEYVIKDYNTAAADSIKMQYRREGDMWRTAKSYAAAAISDSIKATLDVSNTTRYPDGRYELRAAAESAEGVNYSGAVAGVIDRHSLVVAGTEPADGVLHSGDDICVRFSDIIDEASVHSGENVWLKIREDSTAFEINVTCSDCTITILPVSDLVPYAGKQLTAGVNGLKSGVGAVQRKAAGWSFKIDDNYTKIDRDALASIPKNFYLHQNYPNPFNPTTIIEYGVPVAGHVRLSVYNVLGQEIKVLADRQHQPGNYSAVFSVTDGGMAGGVYLYKLEAGRFRKTRKLLILK